MDKEKRASVCRKVSRPDRAAAEAALAMPMGPEMLQELILPATIWAMPFRLVLAMSQLCRTDNWAASKMPALRRVGSNISPPETPISQRVVKPPCMSGRSTRRGVSDRSRT